MSASMELRSSTARAAVVRRARTRFGKRAFSVCGPDVWNSLPIAVRNIYRQLSSFQRCTQVTFIQLCFFLITVIPHIH